MDRLAVAMFHTHGKDVALWPIAVRDLLGFAQTDRWDTVSIRGVPMRQGSRELSPGSKEPKGRPP